MEYNPVQYICNKISSYLLNDSITRDGSKLIKRHTDRLSENGDLSFPIGCNIWCRYMQIEHCHKDCRNIFDHNNSFGHNNDKNIQNLLNNGIYWLFPLTSGKIEKGRCTLFLNRQAIFKVLLKNVLERNDFGALPKDSQKKIFIRDVENVDPDTLTLYRVKLIKEVLTNLIAFSEWQLVPKEAEAFLTLKVCSTSFKKEISDEKEEPKYIQCGVVLDPRNHKLATLTYSDYKSLRLQDTQLMAMHKYGMRIQHQKKFQDLINELGRAAVIVDFLEKKHSSPMQIVTSGHGSTRGANFILYNSARIETLLRSFDERVKQGSYPPLPPLEDIDISLLNEEEEWQLLFNYVFPFPNLIKQCLWGIENGKCAPHLISNFLNGLVSVYSVYYRRVRILMGKRKHLFPLIHAKIYLIKCIRQILNIALGFLNISPVQFM